MNLFPLNTTVSRKVISFSDISAVNFIVGWNVLACSMNDPLHFFYSPKGRKRDQCNVSILLAWYCFVELNFFRSPP